MSVTSEIQRLQTAKADIKTAIEAKGVTVPSETKIDGYAALVDQISQGSAEAPENDVIFYDYDGKRVASYTIAEAKALTALPTPPTHEGLTFQEWNWTLADIQSYNRKYIDVGANYIPTDGKMHIKMSAPESGCSLVIALIESVADKLIVVDWGDGSSDEYSKNNTTQAVTASHTYLSSGNYDCKIYTKDGDTTFSPTIQVQSTIKQYITEVNLSTEVYAFTFINGSVKLTVPKQMTGALVCSRTTIPQITIPRNTADTFSTTDQFNYVMGVVCFPKAVPSITGTRVFGYYTNRMIIPEVDSNTTFGTSSVVSEPSTVVLSIPMTFQFSSAPPTNAFSGFTALYEIDIVQGWIPNYGLNFSIAQNLTPNAIVDFFNKLGDRSSESGTLTLTLGNVLLNKLTAEEKAIATNKGYTLA